VPALGLDSDQPDMAQHAIDASVCDPIGSSNLTDVRKALSSPSAGRTIGEARKRARFAAKITQAQVMVPDWVPDFAFHPMGFDLNGASHRVSISMVHGVHLRCIFLTLQLLLVPGHD
jgi:hypothetical protein